MTFMKKITGVSLAALLTAASFLTGCGMERADVSHSGSTSAENIQYSVSSSAETAFSEDTNSIETESLPTAYARGSKKYTGSSEGAAVNGSYTNAVISVLPAADGITDAGLTSADLSNAENFWKAMFFTLWEGTYTYDAFPFSSKEYSSEKDDFGNAITGTRIVYEKNVVERIGTILLNGRSDIPELPKGALGLTKNGDGYLADFSVIGEAWQTGHTRANALQDGNVQLTAYRVEGEDTDIENGKNSIPEDAGNVTAFLLRPKKTDIDSDTSCEYVIQTAERSDTGTVSTVQDDNILGVTLDDPKTQNYYRDKDKTQILVSEEKLLPLFIGNDQYISDLEDEVTSLEKDLDQAAEDEYDARRKENTSGRSDSPAAANLLSLVTFDDGRYVTLELKRQWLAGGPHGTEKDYYYVLDKKEGKQLKLSDVINNSEADFESIFTKYFSKIDFDEDLEKSAEDIAAENAMEDYQFYITDGYLCIFFNRYDINGSYLPPEFSVEIPFSELDMKISPDAGEQYNDWDYYTFE